MKKICVLDVLKLGASNTDYTASLGLGNAARAEILEPDVFGALKSKMLNRAHAYNTDCAGYLGLGNAARPEILESDIFGAL